MRLLGHERLERTVRLARRRLELLLLQRAWERATVGLATTKQDVHLGSRLGLAFAHYLTRQRIPVER